MLLTVKSDVLLSSGRTIRHTRDVNGSWGATPTTGPEVMTEAEWEEYVKEIARRSRGPIFTVNA